MHACTTEIRKCIDVENDYGMCTALYIHYSRKNVKHCILHVLLKHL